MSLLICSGTPARKVNPHELLDGVEPPDERGLLDDGELVKVVSDDTAGGHNQREIVVIHRRKDRPGQPGTGHSQLFHCQPTPLRFGFGGGSRTLHYRRQTRTLRNRENIAICERSVRVATRVEQQSRHDEARPA
jgi:hypothetical protein